MWLTENHNTFSVLDQCKVLEKYKTHPPSKSVLFITIMAPFKVCALDIVRPMAGKDPRYITTAIYYTTRWLVFQDIMTYKNSDIIHLIGMEIISKLVYPNF